MDAGRKELFDDYAGSKDSKLRDAYLRLVQVIDDNMPGGYELRMQYNMPTYVVPLDTYPDGYISRTKEAVPLPLVSLGIQKNFIAVYHLGLQSFPEILDWFKGQYAEMVPTKLNMGVGCIRLTNPNNIPYELMGELATKISVDDWVAAYRQYRNRGKT